MQNFITLGQPLLGVSEKYHSGGIIRGGGVSEICLGVQSYLLVTESHRRIWVRVVLVLGFQVSPGLGV